VRLDFACGDEVYGSCTELREYLEDRDQAYVLRVPCSFPLALPGEVTLTCKQAAARLARRGWEVRSARTGSKGQRWYAWAWLGTASPRHHLLIRRHLQNGELAFHYCYLPEGQPVSLSRLVRAAGLRWPAEEDFEFGKDCFGLDQSQVRLYDAIARHTVLVMAALAICAVTAALLRRRTDTQAPAPVLPDQPPPAEFGMIPLTVPETGRLLSHPPPPGSAGHWLNWRRGHQARSRWYHQEHDSPATPRSPWSPSEWPLPYQAVHVPSGIRVNAVTPGYFESAVTSGMAETPLGQEALTRVSMGRVVSVDEIVGESPMVTPLRQCCAKARDIRKAPIRLMSMISANEVEVSLSAGIDLPAPALFTSTVASPKAFTALATRESHCSSERTSTTSATHSPPTVRTSR
jgi:hypothetical protein